MNSGASTNPHCIADCLSAADYRRLADFIHASSGIKMPSFGHYMLFSGTILIPIFILTTFVFFRH